MTFKVRGLALTVIFSAAGSTFAAGTALLACDLFAETLLPERQGPRVQTGGSVPHVQIGVKLNAEI